MILMMNINYNGKTFRAAVLYHNSLCPEHLFHNGLRNNVIELTLVKTTKSPMYCELSLSLPLCVHGDISAQNVGEFTREFKCLRK